MRYLNKHTRAACTQSILSSQAEAFHSSHLEITSWKERKKKIGRKERKEKTTTKIKKKNLFRRKRSPFYSSLHWSRHDNCSARSSIKSSSSRPEGTGFPPSVEEIASCTEIIRSVSDRRGRGCARHHCIAFYGGMLLNCALLLCRGVCTVCL